MNYFVLIFCIIVAIVLGIVSLYNQLVGLRNRVNNGWAQIDVLLKQRADLIPNLVETVKGYAQHESNVFLQVTQARADAVNVANNPQATLEQRAAAEQRFQDAIVNLRATAEAYPALQANQNFLNLQNQLRQLEDRIAYGRQFYNDTVMKYNTRIMQFPTNMFAGLFHFLPAQYFTAQAQDRAVPQVQFTNQPTITQ